MIAATRSFRLASFAAACFALLALASSAAQAAGDIYVRAGANFTPVSIAVTPFLGQDASMAIDAVISNDFARSIFLTPLDATSFPSASSIPTRRPTWTPGRPSTPNSC